ncbi:MAG: hypothetical protein JWQ40_1981 [Segetibacter sp.]|nr:hypothetical protein [Segetibacter sp.]
MYSVTECGEMKGKKAEIEADELSLRVQIKKSQNV